jgi:hypothetical protein
MMTVEECIQQIDRMTVDVSIHHFQQNTEELGGMVHLLLQQPRQPTHYLEIGAGAGWVAKVLHSFFHFHHIRLIDNGKHYRGRLEQVPKAEEWIGDSRSPQAREAIRRWGLQYDLIFIDADHAYESVKSDTYLALTCAVSECYFAFHDARHGEVRQWLAELLEGRIPGLIHMKLFGRQSDGKKNLSLFRWRRPDGV